jgi:hypothetical protein
MINDAISALASAWYVTLTATGLLFVALAAAPYWDSAVYLKALHEALTANPM